MKNLRVKYLLATVLCIYSGARLTIGIEHGIKSMGIYWATFIISTLVLVEIFLPKK